MAQSLYSFSLEDWVDEHYEGMVDKLRQDVNALSIKKKNAEKELKPKDIYAPYEASLHCWQFIIPQKWRDLKKYDIDFKKRRMQLSQQQNQQLRDGEAKTIHKIGFVAQKAKNAVKKAAKTNTNEETRLQNQDRQQKINSSNDGLLSVLVIEAVGLPETYPFCRATMISNGKVSKDDQNYFKSNSLPKGDRAIWNQQFVLSFVSPDDLLVVDVYDYKKVTAEVFIGRVVIPLSVLTVQEWDGNASEQFRWFSLLSRDGKPQGKGYICIRTYVKRKMKQVPALPPRPKKKRNPGGISPMASCSTSSSFPDSSQSGSCTVNSAFANSGDRNLMSYHSRTSFPEGYDIKNEDRQSSSLQPKSQQKSRAVGEIVKIPSRGSSQNQTMPENLEQFQPGLPPRPDNFGERNLGPGGSDMDSEESDSDQIDCRSSQSIPQPASTIIKVDDSNVTEGKPHVIEAEIQGDWSKLLDPESKQYYYENRALQKTCWEPPPEWQEKQSTEKDEPGRSTLLKTAIAMKNSADLNQSASIPEGNVESKLPNPAVELVKQVTLSAISTDDTAEDSDELQTPPNLLDSPRFHSNLEKKTLGKLPWYSLKDETIELFVTTFNVGKARLMDDLTCWIPDDFDLYVIGVQECKYNPHEDINTCRDDFLFQLTRHLGRDYSLVKYHSLWEIRLIIFVRNEYKNRISSLRHHNIATGVGNVLGNKGAVMTSFYYCHTPLYFINSHLAAHQEMTPVRNTNYRDIVKSDPRMFSDYTHIFFVGDLNYRIDFGTQGNAKAPSQEQFEIMASMIERNDLDVLLQKDQLITEQKAGQVFFRFVEGNMSQVSPTYKVLRKPGIEFRSNRSPAWTDRVLWRSRVVQQKNVTQMSLFCPTEVCSSDHKPINSTFKLTASLLPPVLTMNMGKCFITIANLKALDIPKVVADIESETNNAIPDAHSKGRFKKQKSKAVSFMKQKMRGRETNPFLKLTAPCLKRMLQTGVARNTENPSWKNSVFGELNINNPHRLAREVIHVEVVNQADKGFNSSLCNGVICLSVKPKTMRNNNIDCPLVCDLQRHGLPAGTLTGKISISWDHSGPPIRTCWTPSEN